MPRYLIQWRSASGNGSWTGSREVDTGGTVPSSGSPVVEPVTGLPNGQSLEFQVVRLDANGNATAIASDVRSATPSRFTLDGADPFANTVRLAWTDQKNWQYFRVARWTTATDSPSPGDVTTTEVTLAQASTSGTVDISGLTDGLTYRFRVDRIAGPLGAVTRVGGNVLAATPQSGFDAPPAGYTAIGPSSVSGDLKAQFAVDSSGRAGILISLKANAFDSITVTYVTKQGTTVIVTWRANDNQAVKSFNTQQLGPTATSNRQFFLYIPKLESDPDPFPVTILNSSPVRQGAHVALDSQGATTNFDVEPTYV
jgi:hypothetical protein